MADDTAWILTLPCTRTEAETLDDVLEPLFADMALPPVLDFSETRTDDPDSWSMHAYFGERPSAALVRRMTAAIPSAAGIRAKAERLAPADWVTMSQATLPPITAGRFHVRNGTDDPPDPGRTNFLIPASRAFGTGQHATTHGCLLMLDRLRRVGGRFGNIADIGTGSGLLAFAARDLWPRAHVMASDIDPAAMAVVADNMTLNGQPAGRMAGRILAMTAPGMDHPAIRARAPYDLIIANILAGPLIALAPAFAAHLADGGSLVLAGLLDTQANAVIAACRRAGLRLAARTDRDGWPTLHLRKRRRGGWRRPERGRADGDGVAPGFGSW